MTRAGFDYAARATPVDTFGRLDPDYVARYGYGLPAGFGDPVTIAAPVGYTVSLGACQAGAETTLFGADVDEFAKAYADLTSIETAGFGDALKDTRYIEAIAAWSGCLSAGGYKAASFGDMISQFEPGPLQAELQAAAADAACRDATGVNDTFEQLCLDHGIALTGDDPALVTRFDTLWNEGIVGAQAMPSDG